MRPFVVTALPLMLLVPAASEGQEHTTSPRQTDLPLSQPGDFRDPEWKRECDRDSLTGTVGECYLIQRRYLAVSNSVDPLSPIYVGGLSVECGGEVTATAIGPDRASMYPMRYVQGDVVLKVRTPLEDADSAFELFTSPSDASWATGPFAFESTDLNGRRSAVWRFVFDDSDRAAVQAFLDGPDCRQ